MGVSFSIACSKKNVVSEEMNVLSKEMKRISNRVEQVQKGLREHTSLSKCHDALRRMEEEMNEEYRKIGVMRTAWINVLEKYESTEKKLLSGANDTAKSNMREKAEKEKGKYWQDKNWFSKLKAWFGWGDSFTEDQIESIVYDDDGAYGGNQGSPMWEFGFWSEKKELYDIVRKYYPDMTDQEIKDYLKKLNNEGCGYVAMINTIFAYYEGREEEFEKDFGFPMYHDGDLNYDKLLVDFYAMTDNHHADSEGKDYIATDEDKSATVGAGTNFQVLEYRMQKYLEEKNAGITLEQTLYGPNEITVENYMEYAEKGQVVIAFYYGNLQNEDGSVAQYIDGGHGMTVTGVTSDGRFIVSSWGKKYYIDPKEIITKADDENNTNTTNFKFQLVNYTETGE